MVYMAFAEPINGAAQEILEIFCRNVAITYDKLLMREDTEDAQRATISILGHAIEKQVTSASSHVQRVSDVATLLYRACGASPEKVKLMRIAASLHDVGKARIPDAILTKSGPLTAEEWAVIKTHPAEGNCLLSASPAQVHVMAAQIAKEHHEHWDGSGYPDGLSGESIALEARIVAVADVLDSLVNRSCYKDAWPLPDAFDYLAAQSGKHFDPALIDILANNQAAIEAIYTA
jgi:response regulator RpfG family c-di-GMP phosphodiesterase